MLPQPPDLLKPHANLAFRPSIYRGITRTERVVSLLRHAMAEGPSTSQRHAARAHLEQCGDRADETAHRLRHLGLTQRGEVTLLVVPPRDTHPVLLSDDAEAAYLASLERAEAPP